MREPRVVPDVGDPGKSGRFGLVAGMREENRIALAWKETEEWPHGTARGRWTAREIAQVRAGSDQKRVHLRCTK